MTDRPDVEWQYPSLDLKHSLRREEACGGEPPVQVPGFTTDPVGGGLSDFDMLALSLLGFIAILGSPVWLPALLTLLGVE